MYTIVSFQKTSFEFAQDLIDAGIAPSGKESRERARKKMDALKQAGMKCVEVTETETGTDYKYEIPAEMADKF